MKDNELIAEFMFEDTMPVDQMRFRTSWDWLIPVVKKCRIDSRCEHDEDVFWDAIQWALEECNREATYRAVVEFINQINKEK